jgi:hypothetical protein
VGTVFELSPNGNAGWSETVLYSFGSQNGDGIQPSSGLVMDTKGNLYGTAEFGANQTGTVFEPSPAAGGGLTGTVIHTSGPSGRKPSCTVFPAPETMEPKPMTGGFGRQNTVAPVQFDDVRWLGRDIYRLFKPGTTW